MWSKKIAWRAAVTESRRHAEARWAVPRASQNAVAGCRSGVEELTRPSERPADWLRLDFGQIFFLSKYGKFSRLNHTTVFFGVKFRENRRFHAGDAP